MAILDVDRFVADGFAKGEAVVPHQVGDAARELLWQRIGLSPDDPSVDAAGGTDGRLVRPHENGPAS
ncbi:hypothetical protein IL992_34885 [Microbispora sp. NEAU-D428]|uniref:hypothetical protein n=1 Tax=Microbispora sitophila TaxID=2771537 RepID=UPI00186723CB|nr:hypothetical protein [Microbispora sitophila]MBE3014323.1 hypothetical protein [Microbispora sitophila]